MWQLKFIARLCQRAPELNLPKSVVLRTSTLAGRAFYPLKKTSRSRVDGALAASLEASFIGDPPHEVEGEVAHDRHVLGPVPVAQAREVLSQDHIEHPMEAVASRPEEFHPRPLTERCGSLSAHTAPT